MFFIVVYFDVLHSCQPKAKMNILSICWLAAGRRRPPISEAASELHAKQASRSSLVSGHDLGDGLLWNMAMWKDGHDRGSVQQAL
jgi:hypothetical protein